MKIAVDIDGVLFDLVITFCEKFNERYDTTYQKSDVTNWEFFNDWNISEEQAFKIFYEIYENSEIVPLIDENSLKYMRELNLQHNVDIVSARSSHYRSHLIKALKSHNILKKIHYRELILVNHKPYDSKLILEYEIYVDDNPNLVEPIKKMKNKLLLLYDQPWNMDSKCEKNVFRVKTWKEVVEKINDVC